jgi:hypothetical protein
LPDGLLSNQKFQFGEILEVFEMEDAGIHINGPSVYLIYFMAIWYILWPLGIFYGHLVNFIALRHIL